MANTLEIIIKATDQASKVVDSITKEVTGKMEDLGKSFVKTGGAMALVTAPAVAGFADAVGAAASFESQMSNIQAILGATKDETNALTQDLLGFGATARAGPEGVAAAFEEIAGGVADASTHMAILESAIATAEAGQADLVGTTSALVSVMNSYSLAAEDAAMVSDVLTQTVGMGVGSMEEFATAMPQVTGLAASLGISFMDVGNAMAFMTTKGFSASQAATQLRAMMVAMLNPNDKMRASLEEIGYASGELAIQELGLVGAFAELNDESPTFQSNMAGAVGSVEALNGVIGLTDDSFASFSKTFEEGAEGATDAARKIQLDNFSAQMDILNSSVETLKIQIGMALIPALVRLVQFIQPVVQAITKWASEHPKLITAIAAVTGVAFVLGTALAALGGAMLLITPILPALAAGFAALTSPIALAIAAIAGLVAAWETDFLGLRSTVEGVVEDIARLLDDLGLIDFGEDQHISLKVLPDIDWSEFLSLDWSGITMTLDALLSELDWSKVAYSVVSNVLDFIGDFFVDEGPPKVAKGIRKAVEGGVGDGVTEAARQTQENAQKVVDFFTAGLQEAELDPAAIANFADNAVTSIIGGLGAGLKEMLPSKITLIPATIGGSLGTVNMTGIYDAAGRIADTILFGMSGAFAIAMTSAWMLPHIITPIVSTLSIVALDSVFGTAGRVGWEILNGIADVFADIGQWVLDNIIFKVGNELVKQAAAIGISAFAIGVTILEGIIDGLTGIGEKILEKLKEEIDKIAGIELIPGTGFEVRTALGVVDWLRQAGGPARAGHPYVVGERRPELFVPRQSGTILPSVPTGQTAGGMNFAGATFIFQGVQDPETFFNRLEQVAKRRNRKLAPTRMGVS